MNTFRVNRRDRNYGEQTALQKQRFSLRGVSRHDVWDVNSTVTQHLDYFVWKDALECVTQSCDDTSWQKASEFLCIWKKKFEGGQQPKFRQKPPEILSPTRY